MNDYIPNDPTKPGVYRWRKNYQWEPITREVRLDIDNQLVTHSERFGHDVPLKWLQAGGSEWHVEDLKRYGWTGK